MVEVPVCKGKNVDAAWFERVPATAKFEVPSLVREPSLKSFAGINDGDAVGPFTKLPLTARSAVGRADAVPST